MLVLAERGLEAQPSSGSLYLTGFSMLESYLNCLSC